jgi:hypothetical protein
MQGDTENNDCAEPASQSSNHPNQSRENVDETSGFECRIEELQATRELIEIIRQARLGDTHCGLGEDFVSQIRNPPTTPLVLGSADERFSIDVYLAITNASREAYNQVREGVLRRYPDSEMLSYERVKRLVADSSGIYPIVHDMCINSCLAYTGVWRDLESCPLCGEPRFIQMEKKKKARQTFHTLPIGPQLQALWWSPEGADNMRYRERRTQELLDELHQTGGNLAIYNDIFCGSDYLEEVVAGRIKSGDMVLLFSIDGAQLYQSKASDTWIYIWVILDHAPDRRYTKKLVLPGGFIPGPKPPNIIDSFLIPGIHHLSAIQNEGLKIWDARRNEVFISKVFLLVACADVLGMAALSGLVGHHGKYGCWLYCALPGRHKENLPQYYPARLKPDNYEITGCDHDDYPVDQIIATANDSERYEQHLAFVERSPNKTQYTKRRLATGICKATILSGLARRLRIPRLFSVDIMHLPALNIPDLVIGLWRGTFDCDKHDDRSSWTWAVLVGRKWKEHGAEVARCTPYLPGSFDRPPRNPAEKMNSGYKAWEWLLYLYGLAPALLFGILPMPFWQSFCKLVFTVLTICQEEITNEEIVSAHLAANAFADELEQLYYQRNPTRIHFC